MKLVERTPCLRGVRIGLGAGVWLVVSIHNRPANFDGGKFSLELLVFVEDGGAAGKGRNRWHCGTNYRVAG